MLRLLNDLPDNTIGVSAEGKVTAKDYETILIPAIEEKLKNHKKIQLLYHLGSSFSDFELAAVLDDAKIGMKHLFTWSKIAIVSDHKIINTLARFFGHLISGEVKIYKDAELEEARKWIIKE